VSSHNGGNEEQKRGTQIGNSKRKRDKIKIPVDLTKCKPSVAEIDIKMGFQDPLNIIKNISNINTMADTQPLPKDPGFIKD